MHEDLYFDGEELCTLKQTDALLTLGMGTEKLYYHEEGAGYFSIPSQFCNQMVTRE